MAAARRTTRLGSIDFSPSGQTHWPRSDGPLLLAGALLPVIFAAEIVEEDLIELEHALDDVDLLADLLFAQPEFLVR